MKDLILPLKRKWFEMWRTGKKNEDYRTINTYWAVRLCQNHNCNYCYTYFDDNEVLCAYCSDGFKPKKFDRLILTCGYPKKTDSEKRLVFENPVISIGSGKPEWGAKENEVYFKISKKF